MDKDFIENIGKESYGRQWKRFNEKKKLEKAFEAVSEEEQCKDGLQASNIDVFVKVLSKCIGDKEQQDAIIRKQVEATLSRMTAVQDDCDLGTELVSAHSKLSLLGLPTTHLQDAFWQAYQKLADEALSTFDVTFYPRVFARPLNQLASYLGALSKIDGDGEQVDKICTATKDLVLKYAMKVMDEQQLCKSPHDFGLILGAMLLPSHHAMLSMHLGALKLELDFWYTNAKTSIPRCCDMLLSLKRKADGSDVFHCSNCGNEFYKMRLSNLKVEDGRLVPADDTKHKRFVSVVIPDSLNDPNHYGYPLWQCCNVLQAATEKK